MCPNDRLSVACCIRVPDQWILAESLRISVLFDRETYNNRMSIVLYAESLPSGRWEWLTHACGAWSDGEEAPAA